MTTKFGQLFKFQNLKWPNLVFSRVMYYYWSVFRLLLILMFYVPGFSINGTLGANGLSRWFNKFQSLNTDISLKPHHCIFLYKIFPGGMSANFEQKNTGDIQTKDTTNIQITDQEKTHGNSISKLCTGQATKTQKWMHSVSNSETMLKCRTKRWRYLKYFYYIP